VRYLGFLWRIKCGEILRWRARDNVRFCPSCGWVSPWHLAPVRVPRPSAIFEGKVAELTLKIAALDWKLITLENLPNVGDEVAYFIYPPTFPNGYCADVQAVCVDWNTLSRWDESRFTHFRSVNPPKEGK
jgi:hypothetical protein